MKVPAIFMFINASAAAWIVSIAHHRRYGWVTYLLVLETVFFVCAAVVLWRTP